VEILPFVSNKITPKSIIYIRFSKETNDELSALFVGSKTGNNLEILPEFRMLQNNRFSQVQHYNKILNLK